MNCRRLAALTAASFISCAAIGAAQTPQSAMSQVLRVYAGMTDFSNLAISPDGTRVAYAKSAHHETTLWIETIGTRQVTRLTAASGKSSVDESEPVWSPDGSHVAFFSDARKKDQPALYVADANGANVRQLNALGGLPQGLQWSPDGRHLAFLYIAHPHRLAGALAPG